MYCPKCGRKNEENAKFCEACGTPLPRQEEQRERGNFQNENGYPNGGDPGREYTESGYQEAGFPEGGSPGNGNPGKRKGSRGAVAALTVLVILCLAAAVAVIALLLSRMREDEEEETQPLGEQPAREETVTQAGETVSLEDYVDQVLIPQLGTCGQGPFVCGYSSENGSVRQQRVDTESGVITSRIDDFDGDGARELLCAVLDPHAQWGDGEEVNAVALQMYEETENGIQKQDEYQILPSVLGSGNLEDDWVFFRSSDEGIYIFGSAYQVYNLYSDGIRVRASIVRYEGETFVEYASWDGTGSDFTDVDISDVTRQLENIGGFEDTVDRMNREHMAYFGDSEGEDVFFSIFGKNPHVDNDREAVEAFEKYQETGDASNLGEFSVQISLGSRTYQVPEQTNGEAAGEDSAGVEENSGSEISGNGDADSGQDAESGQEDYYDRLAELETKEQEMWDQADDQVSINQTAYQIYEMWDDELNYVYQEYKKTLTEEEFQVLRQEELDWIDQRDQQADITASEWEGGSGAPGAVAMTLTQETKERVYELARRWVEGE